jgi:hypothetical protein
MLNVFLLFALPVDALKLPSVPIIESSIFRTIGGAGNSSVIRRRDFSAISASVCAGGSELVFALFYL